MFLRTFFSGRLHPLTCVRDVFFWGNWTQTFFHGHLRLRQSPPQPRMVHPMVKIFSGRVSGDWIHTHTKKINRMLWTSAPSHHFSTTADDAHVIENLP